MRIDDEIITMTPGGRTLVATFDEHHLTVLLFEAVTRQQRPPLVSLDEAYEEIRQRFPEAHSAMQEAAHVALSYVAEQFGKAEPERLQ